MLFQFGALAESWLRAKPNPLAITPAPECEQISGRVYKLGTWELLDGQRAELDAALSGLTAASCTALEGVAQKVDPGIEAYLDWYFSLGGEWQRIGAMLTGNLEELMQKQLADMIGANREAEMLIEQVQRDSRQLRSIEIGEVRRRIGDLLERNRLLLNARDCKVVSPEGAHPLMLHLDDVKRRVMLGSGAAATAGAFAALVSAKAAGKAGMKTAAKVLGKMVAKKAAAMAAGAGIGAAVGSVIIPGIGTAAGAVVGAGIGLVASTGFDMLVLAAEEKLTRDDLKKELQGVVGESLQPYRAAIGCQ